MDLPIDWSIDWERATIEVPDFIYEEFMSEVMSLQPKKRKAWKRTLTDKTGTKTRCMYRDGKIYNHSLFTHKWAEVMPLSESRSAGYVPISSVGIASLVSDEAAHEALLKEAAESKTGNHHRNKSVRIPKSSDGCVRQ